MYKMVDWSTYYIRIELQMLSIVPHTVTPLMKQVIDVLINRNKMPYNFPTYTTDVDLGTAI